MTSGHKNARTRAFSWRSKSQRIFIWPGSQRGYLLVREMLSKLRKSKAGDEFFISPDSIRSWFFSKWATKTIWQNLLLLKAEAKFLKRRYPKLQCTMIKRPKLQCMRSSVMENLWRKQSLCSKWLPFWCILDDFFCFILKNCFPKCLLAVGYLI